MTDSFIADARREQIIIACIDTLEEIGYNNLSLTKVAKRAKISAGLISYHFKDKFDLMMQTLLYVQERQYHFIAKHVECASTPLEKIEAYITAYLTYQDTHFNNTIALIEIVFNAQTNAGMPLYRLEDDEIEPVRSMLTNLLIQGKEHGVFTQTLHVEATTAFIIGALEERMLQSNTFVTLEVYTKELVKMVKKIISNDRGED
ncbi:AcrR family transcriptional regulator [Oikeobacillus pervagus]|uniref:AcrR family transcriptional regulator n=1 Tax=Oikeobacillus pervagus TaxID=1325931 RepID=A0AAJ1T3D1_9BACI|nr:TetR/AcrR family transcriptional regulator [Oikeobacillus pervagus]MDQ0214521.1 AcrR family transcriptional regulator [Oikeobacillus pervagus]